MGDSTWTIVKKKNKRASSNESLLVLGHRAGELQRKRPRQEVLTNNEPCTRTLMDTSLEDLLAEPVDEVQLQKVLDAVRKSKAEVESSGFFASLRRILESHCRSHSSKRGTIGTLLDPLCEAAAAPSNVNPSTSSAAMDEDSGGLNTMMRQTKASVLERVEELVVYGLGSIVNSKVSRYQLGLALLLQPLLAGLRPSTTPPSPLTATSIPALFYDPVFSALDVAVLRTLGCVVLPSNDGGAHPVQKPTFFYLPHCEGVLCEALLRSNRSSSQFEDLAVLGNGFSVYWDRWGGGVVLPPDGFKDPKDPKDPKEEGVPQKERSCQCDHAPLPPPEDKPLCLLTCRLLPGLLEETPASDSGFPAPSAFNDLALHTLHPSVCRITSAAEGGERILSDAFLESLHHQFIIAKNEMLVARFRKKGEGKLGFKYR